MKIEFMHHQFSFIFRAITDKQYLIINVAAGVGKPVNTFAKHSVWLFIHWPQKIHGIKTFKGLQLQHSWGNLLNGQRSDHSSE